MMGDEHLRIKLSHEGAKSVRQRFVLGEVLKLWDLLFERVLAARHRR